MNTLITKKLSSSNLDLIKSWGWHYDVIEALNIAPVKVKSVPQASDAWIISSRNSWHTVQTFSYLAPGAIYCIGSWMSDELKKIGVKSEIKCFENMKALVLEVSHQNIRHVLYFCGDHHRDELEMGLKDRPVTIEKVITHESRLTFPILDKLYDVAFVFSPRAVESLMKNNAFSDQTIFACIGPTTVSYLNEHGIFNTFCPSYPDSKILLTEFHDSKITQKF